MRPIDAEAFQKFIKKQDESADYERCRFEEWLEQQPTIEAKPVVHAHWEWTGVLEEKMFICSHCGECAHYDGTTWWTDPFCWNCGAQMDGTDTNVGSKGVKIPVISTEDVPKIMEEMEK